LKLEQLCVILLLGENIRKMTYTASLLKITEDQNEMLNKFFENPDETMKDFLINHPDFLEDALRSDEKTVVRARLCIEGNLYGLN